MQKTAECLSINAATRMRGCHNTALNQEHLMNGLAPRPGFEPGSSGRQPLILDRTILPGLSIKGLGREMDNADFDYLSLS
jgi:hypothetical protein